MSAFLLVLISHENLLFTPCKAECKLSVSPAGIRGQALKEDGNMQQPQKSRNTSSMHSTPRTFRTPKGTELPILNLRGKEYLEVKYRIVWFREDHPEWAIETELLSVTDNNAYARATVKDEAGRTIATSHKFEAKQGFPDFIEKAETGAIGRSLALVGYGTQFCADELSEAAPLTNMPSVAPRTAARSEPVASSLVTPSPVGPVTAAASEARTSGLFDHASPVRRNERPAGDYEISFGRKYKGKMLKDIPLDELEGYLDWLTLNAARQGQGLSDEVMALKKAFGEFQRESSRGLDIAI
jgi:hypothetical protein